MPIPARRELGRPQTSAFWRNYRLEPDAYAETADAISNEYFSTEVRDRPEATPPKRWRFSQEKEPALADQPTVCANPAQGGAVLASGIRVPIWCRNKDVGRHHLDDLKVVDKRVSHPNRSCRTLMVAWTVAKAVKKSNRNHLRLRIARPWASVRPDEPASTATRIAARKAQDMAEEPMGLA